MPAITPSIPDPCWRPGGARVLGQPLLNKDGAFTDRERAALGLRGLLPWRCTTIEQQVALELEHLRSKSADLEKYIGLEALQDRNETLFYRLLVDHLEELAPIVYTPTVGEACRRFSHILRRPRGLWITPEDIDRIPELLHNTGREGVRLIVVTDNERILGLGDQGAGGMGIPVGKLALYCAGAGVRPALTLPVSLDCGTDNQGLLDDPLYLGYPKPRLRGPGYDAFIEAFVQAVREVYPGAIVQWEDFKQHNALRLLDRYRHRLACFNDDIQGTAAVVVGGILAALRHRGQLLSGQRLVFLGAGAAGIGIARLAESMMRSEGASPAAIRRAIIMLDSRGLIYENRSCLDEDKRPFALPASEATRLGLGPARPGLETVVQQFAPTILIGTTGRPGLFTQTAIRDMAARTPAPIVMPLSNPTANAEATPADVLRWTEGRALVATGSPFGPVRYGGMTRQVGQANNMLIFPGVGLAAIASRAREITDQMFGVAATTLASLVTADRFAQGALYPPIADLRRVSCAVAVSVATQARQDGVAQLAPDDDIEKTVATAMWHPSYPDILDGSETGITASDRDRP
ncbi:MAG TPA: NAD-dependent malic enzyme [Streptosporangiaceae bacterium]|nr:NAD-dependent malic enzyme [Streptosporangiaceae bacterium]